MHLSFSFYTCMNIHMYEDSGNVIRIRIDLLIRVDPHTQNVLELPSTAMLAPWPMVSKELLALIALRAATSSAPAAEPLWLKHCSPDRPSFN